MDYVGSIKDLVALYGPPMPAALLKVSKELTPLYEEWIRASRFCILSTVTEEKTDNSPRGDKESVVKVADSHTLLLPDWPGNNRLDSLRNIILDERASLMFMIPGVTTVVRINGTAKVTVDLKTRQKFIMKETLPSTVIVFKIREVYIQCSKAVLRSELWNNQADIKVPTLADIIDEVQINK